MRLRTFARCCAAASVAVASVAGFMVLGTDGADALEQERITLRKPGIETFEFGPITGSSAGATLSQSLMYTPETCGLSNACDLIPLTIVDPKLGDSGDFFVKVRLSWDTEEVQTNALGETVSNDLDMYISNDPIEPEAGPDEDGFTYKAASAAQPENAIMTNPAGDWFIYVGNYAGVNGGYTLTFEWVEDKFPDPFESLPPEFGGPPKAAITTDTTLPRPAVTPTTAPPAKPDLSLGSPPAPDTDFSEGFADNSANLGNQLTPPTTALEAEPIAESSDPSTGALLLWLLAVPLAVVALGAGVLARRQSTMIRL